MGLDLGGLTSLATFGIVDDPFGTEEAQDYALAGTREAMDVTERLGNRSLDLQESIWDWQKEQAAPWTEAGLGALGQYQDTMAQGFSFDPGSDPVYGARLSELSKAIGTSGAARGMQLSGRTLRSLREMTASELGSSYGRQREAYQTKLANLGNLINIGASSATGLAGIGSNFAATAGGTMQQLGQSLAQGHMNIGAINAQAATAPFQNLMSLANAGGAVMTGYGAL